VNIEEVLKMWKDDSVIDEFKLDDVTIKTARMHSKYLELITIAKMGRKKRDFEYKTLLKDKWLYYEGKLSREQIDEFGWEYDPYKGLNKPLKGQMNYYYDADSDIQKMQALTEYDKVLIETLEEIMNTIRWRHQNIGNIIKWRAFESGA
jgi:c-di-GMP-related signal transduction protein|tara:strand:+ start:375 stop:821 length:447 start_codon:yes stop_codon:yes gene_type:complete